MALDIDHPELAALHLFWSRQAADGRLPDRAAFTPEALRPWLGHIGIVEVEREPVRLRVRLAGLHLVEHDGHDNTSRYLHEAIPEHDRDLIIGAYLRCLESRTPQYEELYSHPAPDKRHLMRRLLLPVSVDGRGVDQIIAGIYTLPAPAAPRGA